MKGDQMSPERPTRWAVFDCREPIAECCGVFRSRIVAEIIVASTGRTDFRLESIAAIAAELAAEEACHVP
jgi:hypothetical protein